MVKRLQQQTLELKRSNGELEQFAYVASHDLQEPLRMVASYTSLIKKRYQGNLDADADEFIGFAVDGATRMQGLINDLLTYSRAGNEPQPSEPTDAGAALDTALANLRRAIEEKSAVIVRDRLPLVMANLIALAWFGMWAGLNSKSTNLAALKAIVFVQIIPWFVVSFVSVMVVPLLLLPRVMKGTVLAPNQLMVVRDENAQSRFWLGLRHALELLRARSCRRCLILSSAFLPLA